MNQKALNDPNQQKYSNIANSYFNSTPTLYNLSNGVWNKIKSLYFGTKAAYKADSEMMNKYRKDQLNRGNIKRAIFGSPYVPYVESLETVPSFKK